MKQTKSDKVASLKAKGQRAKLSEVKADRKVNEKINECVISVEKENELALKALLAVDESIVREDESAIKAYFVRVEDAKKSNDSVLAGQLYYPLADMICKSKLRFQLSGHSKSMKKTEDATFTVYVSDGDNEIATEVERKSAKSMNFDDSAIMRNMYNSLCANKPNHDAKDIVQQCILYMEQVYSDYGTLTEDINVIRIGDTVHGFIYERADNTARNVYAVNITEETMQASKLVFRLLGQYIREQHGIKYDFRFRVESMLNDDNATYLLDRIQTTLAGENTVTLEQVKAIDRLVERLFTELSLTKTESYILARRLEQIPFSVIASNLDKTERAVYIAMAKIQEKFLNSPLAHEIGDIERAIQYIKMDYHKSSDSFECKYTNDNGDSIIGTFTSVRGCSKAIKNATGENVDPSNISKCLHGLRASTNGFTFRYVYSDDDDRIVGYKESKYYHDKLVNSIVFDLSENDRREYASSEVWSDAYRLNKHPMLEQFHFVGDNTSESVIPVSATSNTPFKSSMLTGAHRSESESAQEQVFTADMLCKWKKSSGYRANYIDAMDEFFNENIVKKQLEILYNECECIAL